MKLTIAAVSLALCACTVGPLAKVRPVDQSECVAACGTQYERCPQMFSAFPERGAIECPAAQQQCLRGCVKTQVAAAGPLKPPPAAPLPQAPPPAPPSAAPSAPPAPTTSEAAAASLDTKETRLRELKHFHDQGLITDDVYRERQMAILSEP